MSLSLTNLKSSLFISTLFPTFTMEHSYFGHSSTQHFTLYSKTLKFAFPIPQMGGNKCSLCRQAITADKYLRPLILASSAIQPSSLGENSVRFEILP